MKRIWITVFAVTLVLFVPVDFLLHSGQDHGDFPWSHVPGFFALFGFVGCVIIVVVSKLLGHYWLQRKEGYYDRDSNDK
jgi:hypothetical protein